MKDDEHVDMSGVEMSQLLSDVSCNNAYKMNVLLLLTALDSCLSVRAPFLYI